MRTSSEVLDQLKKVAGIKTDAKLAELLGVKPNSVSTWRTKNKVPYEEIILFCEHRKLRVSEILHGENEGEMKNEMPEGGVGFAENIKQSDQHSDMNGFVQLFRDGTGMLTIGDKIGYIRKCGDSLDEEDLLRVQMDFEDGTNKIIKRILERQNSLKKNIAG